MRSEREKWEVPESDPAGKAPEPSDGRGSINLPQSGIRVGAGALGRAGAVDLLRSMRRR